MSPGDVRFLEFGRFRFDVRNRRLTCDERVVPLTPKAADLLLALLNARGDVVIKKDLLAAVWADTFVEEGNLAFHIHAIRDALKEGSDGQRFIENIPRRGYRFAVPITEVKSPTAPEDGPSIAESAQTPTELPTPARQDVARRPIITPILALVLVVTALVGVVGAVAYRRSQPRRLRVVSYTQLTSDRRDKNVDRPLLVDGANIYFREPIQGPSRAVSVLGGETHIVDNVLRDYFILDVRQGGGEYLVARQDESRSPRQLWALTSSGTLRRVGTLACDTATWSPDGKRVACAAESLQLANADGSEIKPVAMKGTPQWPSWSPDGSLVRFTVASVVGKDVREAIWEVRSDGTGLRRLPLGTSLSNECCGFWTPDSQQFVFGSARDGREDLWVLAERNDLLGRVKYESVPLTAGPLSFGMAGISADGTRIFAVGTPPHGELVRYDRSLKSFVPFLDGVSAIWVDFSRDGRSVVYIRFPENTLWRANSDGTGAKQLTQPGMKTDGCFWSPDGKQIAFRGSVAGGPFRIFIISSEGGEAKPLIADEYEQGIPTWSPDGTRLVFGGVPMPYGRAKGETIQIYDLRTHQISTLPDSTNLWTPRWSPDGRYISAVTVADRSLRLFDVATRSWKAFSANRIDNPTWSQDSQFISYDTEGPETRALRRVRISDGQMEEIASLEGFASRAYWWSGLSFDGSPLVLKQLGGPEIYALELEER